MLRPATAADEPFLWDMLYQAVFWDIHSGESSIVDLRADSKVDRYVAGWGREGDDGLIAEEDGTPVGAAWRRLFRPEEPGFGFVAGSIPEVAIGVVAEHRGAGIGTRLLNGLAGRAALAGFRGLSSSVQPGNPAGRLYQRCGYRVVEERADGLVMRLDLRPPPRLA